ncbi:MAG: 4Fe-4S binding protein [Deltaproteobacteria bacterium]
MDAYEKLREVLHKNPIGAPKSDAFDEILRVLFTPEEAHLALGMAFVPRNVRRIATAAGVSEERAAELCESMAEKGIVFSREQNGELGYALVPTMPGLFEFPFMTGGGGPQHGRLAELWGQYHHEAFGHEFGGSDTPVIRVIPIEQTVDARSEVLPYEIVSKMFDSVETFGLAHCACRVTVAACDRPRETCLMFDNTARFLIDRGFAREITKEEAEQTLREAEEAGLVHTCNNSQDRLTVICNCCPCCCAVLRGLTELQNPNAFARSRWHASVDPASCTGCGTCRDERCPVAAVALIDEIATVHEAQCIGCGLCVSTCPEQAISMVPRKQPSTPPATVTEMGMRVLTEKGRLEEYVNLNKG